MISILEKNGKFSAKSTHAWMQKLNLSSKVKIPALGLWGKIWRIKIPKRIKLFIWKLGHQKLQTIRYKKRITVDKLCPRCGTREETNLHCIFFCQKVRHI